MAFMIRSELPPLIADCRLSSSAPAFMDTWAGRVTTFISIKSTICGQTMCSFIVKAPDPCCTLFAAKLQRRWRPPQESYLKKIMEKTTFYVGIPFPSPTPPQKTKNPAQICSNIGFWMVGDSEPRESTAYFDQLPEILPPAGVENLLEKSAWRGEAKRLPSKPEPKKQYMSTSSHLCSIPCSIDLWIASLELYLSYLSKSGGLWEIGRTIEYGWQGSGGLRIAKNNVAALCES